MVNKALEDFNKGLSNMNTELRMAQAMSNRSVSVKIRNIKKELHDELRRMI